MKLMWIAGLLLLLQQLGLPDNLRIDHHGKTIKIIKHDDYTLPGSSIIDLVKVNQLLDYLDKRVYQAPVNAKIGSQEQNIPEQMGYKLNRNAFRELFFSYFFDKGSSVLEVPRLAIHANVDSELLAHIREKSIGHYATYFNANNTNRSFNIALAAKTINNHVVFPGETFSFNQVVGERTEEKGYLRASVIVKGELSEGIGGGICQVSSTLFNSADRAGLKIVRRYSHSRNVPYVPPGRDATVSWDGPDFVFQNQYNQPILIRSTAGRGTLLVSLYSSHVIEYKPREVPGVAKGIPKEISQDKEASHDDKP